MATLSSGIQRYGVLFDDRDFTLASSVFAVGNTTIFIRDASGNLKSWQNGRSAFLNTFSAIPGFAAFEVAPGGSITVSDYQFSFGSAIVTLPYTLYANYSTATRAGTAALKNSAGRLVSLDSDGTALSSPYYLQFFDAVAVPTAGARCKRYFPVLPGSLLVYGEAELEMDFTAGIVVAASATRDTYTAVAAGELANIYFTVGYR